jgi:hypothetical protein
MDPKPTEPCTETQRLCQRLTYGLLLILVVGMVLFALRRDWENVFLTAIVIGLTLLPIFLSRHFQIYVPPEFQLVCAGFVFLSLFLGSGRDYYYRFWWWDIVLHTGSGFLLGIVGLIAMFLLNQTDHLPRGIRPVFLCFFAVTFAVTLGVIWEIFEFVVDRIWPEVNMQSNETGVADTMHDLIVDTGGAVIVALMGWAYIRCGRYSFLVDGIMGFVKNNPKLFPKKSAPPRDDQEPRGE